MSASVAADTASDLVDRPQAPAVVALSAAGLAIVSWLFLGTLQVY